MNRNITATVLIVLAIGIYFTVTADMLTKANAINAVNAKYTSAIESAKKLIAVRDKVLQDYNNLTLDDRGRLEKMIPRSVDNIRLIIDMNSIAMKHGFSLKGIKATTASSKQINQKPSNPVAQNPMMGGGAVDPDSAVTTIPVPVLDTVTMSFGVSAPYQQFISFMQDIEANLRIMDVTHLTATANDSGVYDWNVELKTYWLKSQ